MLCQKRNYKKKQVANLTFFNLKNQHIAKGMRGSNEYAVDYKNVANLHVVKKIDKKLPGVPESNIHPV